MRVEPAGPMRDVVGIARLRDLLDQGQRRLREEERRARRLRSDQRLRLHWTGVLMHPLGAAMVSLCAVLLAVRAGLELGWAAPLALVGCVVATVGLGQGLTERIRRQLVRRLGAIPVGISGADVLWTHSPGSVLRIEPLFSSAVPTEPTLRALLAAAAIEEVAVTQDAQGQPVLVLARERLGSAVRAVRVLEEVIAPLARVFPVLAVRVRSSDPAPRVPSARVISRRSLRPRLAGGSR